MKYLKIILIGILFPLISTAQSNFQPGFVVTLKGDTIKGFINNEKWDSNPIKISFKDSLNTNNVREFNKNNINYFCIDSLVCYKKYSSSISLNNIDIDNLGSESDTTYKVDTVFFKVLQYGKYVSLYSYTDKIKTRYYLGEYPDYSPKELIFRIYKNSGIVPINRNVTQEGNTYIENIYLKQLFAAAAKYNSIDGELTRLFNFGKYKDYSLEEIVTKINKHDIDKTHNSKINYFVGAGLNVSSISSNSNYTNDGGQSYSSAFPYISSGINITPDSKTQKFELRFELQLSINNYDNRPSTESVNFNQLNMSFFPQIIYNLFSDPDFKIFLGIGVAVEHHNFYNSFYQDGNNKAVNHFDGYSSEAYMFKFGIKTGKRISFYINKFEDTSITNFGNLVLGNSNTNIGMTYFFGK